MGKYQRFEEIPVWQEAARLYQFVLDVVEEPNVPLSAAFRNQLERASLAVSNAVAEGFEVKAADVLVLLSNAHGAAAEVQSMVSIISERPRVARLREPLQQIRASAESCARQLSAWKWALENPGPRKGSGQESSSQAAGTGSKPQNWKGGGGSGEGRGAPASSPGPGR